MKPFFQFLLLWTKTFALLTLSVVAVVAVLVGLMFTAEYSPVAGLVYLLVLASGIFAFTKAWIEDVRL